MPANKNALIRYKTIDNCLRNRFRCYTLDDLVEACGDALYEMEGIANGVSVRTVQGDIQTMRSDKLGYNAPIVVYDHKYYKYDDPDYSIMNMPLSQNDYEVMSEAVDMLRQLGDFVQFSEISDVVGRLQDKLQIEKHNSKPIIHFDSVPNLKGLKYLNPLYNYIAKKQAIRVRYHSFKHRNVDKFVFFPYLLKEFRNRWFVFGSRAGTMRLLNLALDRIECIDKSDVPYQENRKFDSEHYFEDMIGVTRNIDDKPRKVRFWATSEESQYIKTKPVHHTQQLISQNAEDQSCIFQIEVVINYEMYSVLMGYGPGVKIISPRGAVNYMRIKLREAAALYDKFIDAPPAIY